MTSNSTSTASLASFELDCASKETRPQPRQSYPSSAAEQRGSSWRRNYFGSLGMSDDAYSERLAYYWWSLYRFSLGDRHRLLCQITAFIYLPPNRAPLGLRYILLPPHRPAPPHNHRHTSHLHLHPFPQHFLTRYLPQSGHPTTADTLHFHHRLLLHWTLRLCERTRRRRLLSTI